MKAHVQCFIRDATALWMITAACAGSGSAATTSATQETSGSSGSGASSGREAGTTPTTAAEASEASSTETESSGTADSGGAAASMTSEGVSTMAPGEGTDSGATTSLRGSTDSGADTASTATADDSGEDASSTMEASESSGGAMSVSFDRFGIRQLYPTAVGGKIWEAAWDVGGARDFDGIDPADPWFDAAHGNGRYAVDGEGVLRVSGSSPRMYVHDPAHEDAWRDVEITVYMRRVADDGVAYGGMVAFARTNHGTIDAQGQSGDPPSGAPFCDSRGIGGRVRYDGRVDFEKETNHPSSAYVLHDPLPEVCAQTEGCDPSRLVTDWSSGMPFDTWIGYKYVVYDLDDERVRLELWIDETQGRDGGSWMPLAAFVDDGTQLGDTGESCASGIDPRLPLLASDDRPGSESGKPNITVYFRSDGVGDDGLWMRAASVREIDGSSGP